MTQKLLVGVDEAISILSIGRSKLLEMTYAGDIPSLRVGRRRLYKVSELEAWADKQQELEEDYIALPH
jgi:excisionase family DNA binding protein